MSQREQQTARVNVDDATWQTFRIRAIQAGRSVADELGRLVRNDLRRARPTDPSRPSTSEPSATEVQEALDSAPTERATTKVQRGRPRQRLADLDLLTELPYRDQPPPSPVVAKTTCRAPIATALGNPLMAGPDASAEAPIRPQPSFGAGDHRSSRDPPASPRCGP